MKWLILSKKQGMLMKWRIPKSVAKAREVQLVKEQIM
jgi:hypothetical protein